MNPLSTSAVVRNAGGLFLGASLLASLTFESAAYDFEKDFPFLKACVTAPGDVQNTANKGIVIRLNDNANILFDQDLLRVAAGWTGGYITDAGVSFSGSHGGHPQVEGDQKFITSQAPGWADEDGSFEDTRPEPYGPHRAIGSFDGIYVNGRNVVLSYTVLDTPVFEFPTAVERDGQTVFVRNLQLAPEPSGLFRRERTPEDLAMVVCEVPGGSVSVDGNVATVTGESGKVTKVVLNNAGDGVSLAADGTRVLLKVEEGTRKSLFNVAIWSGDADQAGAAESLATVSARMIDFKDAAPTRWPETVRTEGALAVNSTDDEAYVVDRLTVPEKNPWNRQIRFGGFDFFPDGESAALSTWDGDVWLVSGIDEDLDNLTWRRFASGGFETLGLKVVDGKIYTSGRDQITRYHDFNNDGEADFYETFNDDITSSPGFHEFVFDLQTDKQGNFYFAKAAPVRGGGRGFGGGGGNGEITAHAGTLVKVSADGEELDVVATGLRAPNGIGLGPDGQLTTGDNEGTFVKASPINWIEPGGFYGVEDTAHREPVPARDTPLMWLSHKEYDNSSGSQVWVTSDKWGPYEGELLHLSYGKSSLNVVFRDEVDGEVQGAALHIPIKLTSSAMRGRFNPADGQLYIAGLRGWQTSAANLTGLDRVRYTGKPVYSVESWNVTPTGVEVTFTQPLDPEDAVDTGNYAVERWGYAMRFDNDRFVDGRLQRGPKGPINYGGHEVHYDDPQLGGRQEGGIKKITLSPDGKTVSIELENHRPVEQLMLRYSVITKDDNEVYGNLLQTINAVP